MSIFFKMAAISHFLNGFFPQLCKEPYVKFKHKFKPIKNSEDIVFLVGHVRELDDTNFLTMFKIYQNYTI